VIEILSSLEALLHGLDSDVKAADSKFGWFRNRQLHARIDNIVDQAKTLKSDAIVSPFASLHLTRLNFPKKTSNRSKNKIAREWVAGYDRELSAAKIRVRRSHPVEILR
jgi:hypothetical protein